MPRIKKVLKLHEMLRKRREELRYSVDEVSKKAGIPNITYNKIERAESKNPHLKNITKIARVLDLSLDDLVKGMYQEDEDMED